MQMKTNVKSKEAVSDITVFRYYYYFFFLVKAGKGRGDG